MKNLNLKMILEAVDKVTAPVRNITNSLRTATNSANGAVGAMRAQLDRIRIGAAAAARAIIKNWNEVADKMDKVGKKAAEIGGFLTARVSLPIIGVGALSIRAAGQMEELTIQMEHLAGSADKARQFVFSLQGYIDKFGVEEFSATVKQLETAGYSMDEIRTRLSMLGEVAAGSRTSLAGLTDQYISLRKAGKVSDGDLQTMIKSNIPIVEQLAKSLGKTEKQVWNMAANGKITFQDYRKAMMGLTEEGGRFHGMMDRQGKSINGVFKELRNSLTGIFSEFGAQLWEDLEIGDKIKSITESIRGLVKGFMGLPPGLKSAITWFALIMAAIGPIVVVIGQFIVGIAGLMLVMGKMPLAFMFASKAIKFFMVSMTGVAAIMNFITAIRAGYTVMQAFNLVLLANPIGVVMVAIAALAGAGYLLIKNWEAVKGFFIDLWNSIKNVFNDSVTNITAGLQPLLEMISKVLSGAARIGRAVSTGVNKGINLLAGGSDEQNSSAPSAGLGAISRRGAANSKVDAGGTIKIEIAQDGKARVAETNSNDRRIQFQSANTGALMGGI